MIYVGPIFCALHCGGNGIAISHQDDARANRTNDGLQIFSRKLHKAGELVCQSLLHTKQRLLPVLDLLAVDIVLLIVFLFRFFCNVFYFLGIVFLFGVLFFPQGLRDIFWCIRNGMFCIDLNNLLLLIYFYKIDLKVFPFDNDYKLSWTPPILVGMEFKSLEIRGQ